MSINKEVFKPKKEMFSNPVFNNMNDYYKLVNKFEENYEQVWGELADADQTGKVPS